MGTGLLRPPAGLTMVSVIGGFIDEVTNSEDSTAVLDTYGRKSIQFLKSRILPAAGEYKGISWRLRPVPVYESTQAKEGPLFTVLVK